MNFKYQGLGTYKRDTVGRFSSFKSWVRKWVRRVIMISLVGGSLYVAGAVGALFFSTSTVVADTKTVTMEASAPVLDRIADCESGNGKAGTGSQIGKDGQVVIHVNNNGTWDIGKYQINSIHDADATKRGFDLYTLEGNTGYAKYMYANLGTGDWASSQACWKK